MPRKPKTVAELYAEQAEALQRCRAQTHAERHQARKDVERIEKAIIRAERREQRDGELS